MSDISPELEPPKHKVVFDKLLSTPPEALKELVDAMYDGSIKAELDEAVGYDPDLMW